MDGRVHASFCHCIHGQVFQGIDSHCQQILKERAYDVEGQEEDKAHDYDEHGNCGEFAGQHGVDFLAADTLLALARFGNAFGSDFPDVGVAHVGHCSRAVKAAFVLHLQDYVLQHLGFVSVQFQLLQNQFVAADDLAGRKADGKSGSLGMVLDEVDYGMQASVNRTAVVVDIAEVLPQRAFLIDCNVHGMLDKLVHALVLCSRDGNHRNPEHVLHGIDVHASAV